VYTKEKITFDSKIEENPVIKKKEVKERMT